MMMHFTIEYSPIRYIMSKARPQTSNRRLVRDLNTIPFRRKNNRKSTNGRHTQYVGRKVVRHTNY
jgi:hypothetical protein